MQQSWERIFRPIQRYCPRKWTIIPKLPSLPFTRRHRRRSHPAQPCDSQDAITSRNVMKKYVSAPRVCALFAGNRITTTTAGANGRANSTFLRPHTHRNRFIQRAIFNCCSCRLVSTQRSLRRIRNSQHSERRTAKQAVKVKATEEEVKSSETIVCLLLRHFVVALTTQPRNKAHSQRARRKLFSALEFVY